jgi:excisionase family DNA binding protein
MNNVARFDDQFMSVRDIAEYTGLSDRTVRKLVKEMACSKSSRNGKILVRRSEVDRYFDEQRNNLRSADPVVKEFLTWISKNGREN